ncbi:NAD(P)-dependent alcohol dehydrogenase [Williamsia sp. CHRR-6]|uniref:NAD(P)-dependent alcohol dehydrogenase n=1 Tax=Williamsia sp. CHRR-6 TaxID=2835871 RepID=UPI001BD93258|nr:NAD(P)-dependent alcohol dehydrogenase [Williamsia sp. CHRR-6]MBT0566413.1 NAD(P)-dependent alcohol dehydrogenase [Williamsia sp. CHRR-6]
MKTVAAVSTGAHTPFSIEDVDLDDPRPDELLIRIESVGICHTDLAIKSVWPEGVPIVLGHEGAGIVEQVGSDIDDVRVGERVVVSFSSCGRCEPCVRGLRNYCRNFQAANASGKRLDGTATITEHGKPVAGAFFGQSSFAGYILTRRSNAVVVDPRCDLSLVASFGCGIQTGAGAVLNVLRPEEQSSLVVFGAGAVGMAAVMAAANLGVGQIIAVDVTESRRETALQVGATHALDGRDVQVVDKLKEITAGGASHAFDTTGIPAVIRNAALSLGTLGTLVVVGTGPDLTVDAQDLINGGKTIRGCIEGDANPQEFIPQLVQWQLEGKFPMEKLVRTFPFSKINEAIEASESGGVIKAVLTFDE